MRAFLNGRIDLPQAEAVRDLIGSRTLFQARVAAQQMEGSLSARLRPAKESLTELIARLEAGIDFADDDVPVWGWEEITAAMLRVQSDLALLTESYAAGRIIHDGLNLSITGRPNVGKSSLFNRLLSDERSIVTEIPGTTRDLVSEVANLRGIPVRLVDTAGIRETPDRVEQLGVEKSLQAAADADLRILVIDGSEGWTEEDSRLLARIFPHGPIVIACNKTDLPPKHSPKDVERRILGATEALGQEGSAAGAVVFPAPAGHGQLTWVSALTGSGISGLGEKILSAAASGLAGGTGGEFITNLRQKQALDAALASLARAGEGARRQVHHEMLLLDLYDALHSLDELSGATTVEDVLGKIFSTFCVGK